MYNYSKTLLNLRTIFIFAFFCLSLLFVFHPPAAAADNYSAEEKVYLRAVTPILYEYSAIASQVSASVLSLQSSPAENCSGQFSYYGGIMDSLDKHLAGITPPPRLEAVHDDALSTISEYGKGLGLYTQACAEEDFGVKESLVSQAGAYVNRSVGTIGRVYQEIGNLGAVSADPQPARSQASPEELTEAGIETGEVIEEGYTEENAAEEAAAAADVKTREDVIDEIAGRVNTDEQTEAAGVPPPSVPKATEPAPAPQVVTEPAPGPETPDAALEEAEEEIQEAEAPAPGTPDTEPAPAPQIEAKPEPPAAPEVKAPEAASETITEAEAPVAAPPAPAAPEVTTPEAPSEVKTEAEAIIETDESQEPGETKTDLTAEKANPAAKSPAGEPAVPDAQTIGPPAPEAPAPAAGGDSLETAAVAPGTEELTEEALPEDEIKSWCMSRFSTDFEQSACVTQRTQARDKTESLLGAYADGTPEREILEKCRSDWKEGITYNYEMVVSCTQFFCTQKGLESCKDLSK